LHCQPQFNGLVGADRKSQGIDIGREIPDCLGCSGTSGVSGLLNATCGADVPTTEFKTFSIPITTGTASSYIQFRTESTATVYIDEITISNGNPTTVVNLTPVNTTATSHSFADLTEGTEYKIWVTAKDGSGNSSASSNAIYVTPQSSTPNAVAAKATRAITVVAVNGKLTIKGGSHNNVAVYSAMGQLVYQGMLLGDDELLPVVVGKGLYLVKTGQQTTKVLVK
jgi:chitodextrinase